MADVTLTTVDATWVNPAAVTYDAQELRLADAALFSSPGIARGLEVTVDGTDTVTVQPGSWVVDGEDVVTGAGVYRGGIGAAVSSALEARDATYGRVDLVVARQYDADVASGHTTYTGAVEVITGTPAASPVAKPLPDMAVELAKITVPVSGGGAATVDTSGRQYAQMTTDTTREWTQSARVTVSIPSVNTTHDMAVTFPKPYTSPPRVVVQPEVVTAHSAWAFPQNITETGFTLRASRDVGGDFPCHWIASGT